MEGITKKLKSCTCPKDQKNAAGQRACLNCGPGAAGVCSCKTNKCKCAGCPNARTKTKEGKDASSSSSSDEN